MPRPPPEECQLFNMEPALGKLEALFQNAKAQLDWIKNQLECEIRENLPEGAGAEEDPFALLEELSVVGSRHEALCQQMEQILTERQQIMEDIGANVQDTVRILQELQENVGLESSALSAEEQAAAQQLGFQIGENMESPVEELHCAGAAGPGSAEGSKFKPLTEEMLLTLPSHIRRNVTLADLNSLYRELVNHFTVNKNRAALSVSELEEMSTKSLQSRIQGLKELRVVDVDREGNIQLVV
ncbi:spindle and kinetochore-associated protein 2 isoform X2 [Pithys albifrons albifrons]|uniref:spindle and kinetochore-associated protein 2 isoform X2 n=1 Tax=Pithys albifrons albifrons TaxID=3385563 RepID=UPI003A5CC71B